MAQRTVKDSPRYHAVDVKETDGVEIHSTEPDNVGQPSSSSMNRPWASTLGLQLLSFAWLVPIAALFYLNAAEYIIGATTWCPQGDCSSDRFGTNATQRALELAEESRNVIGGLQFVAKALEAWFVFVAAALLYLVTMAFASRAEGLPIGYLTRSMNFSTPIGLADSLPSFGRRRVGQARQDRRTVHKRGTWLLALLSVVLFALCNLMGPATAVLVLPVLQWVEAPKQDLKQLTGINNARPPFTNPDSWFYNSTTSCSAAQYEALNYTCAYEPYGQSLDAWVANVVATDGKRSMASESLMTFEMNQTTSTQDYKSLTNATINSMLASWVKWVPSRQTIASLRADLEAIAQLSNWKEENRSGRLNETTQLDYDEARTEYESYDLYTDTLELELRRNGPILGAITTQFLDYDELPYRRAITVDPNRVVICYSNYNIRWVTGELLTNYTKCTRNGGGWESDLPPDSATWRNFSIDARYDSSSATPGPSASATIISSDRTVFLPNGTLPTWFDAACLDPKSSNTPLLNCDWETFFHMDPPDPRTISRTENMVTIEYRLRSSAAANSSQVLFATDFAAFSGFTEYSVNTSPTQNQARLVRTERLPDGADIKPIFVDPTWVLAGWAADHRGAINPYRPASNLLMYVLQQLLVNKDQGYKTFEGTVYMDAIAMLPVMQALSLIDYTAEEYSGPKLSNKQLDSQTGLLYRHARMFVWAYGFNSRTARLGAVVAILGALVVLVQVVVGFVDRRRYRTPTQLLVAALEHAPRGEFDGRPHKESALAKAEFRVVDDPTRAGKLSFHAPHR